MSDLIVMKLGIGEKYTILNIVVLLHARFRFCKNGIYSYVGFEVFTAVVLKSIIFWDMTPCSPLSLYRRFGGIYSCI
jgi:hypothetical protein